MYVKLCRFVGKIYEITHWEIKTVDPKQEVLESAKAGNVEGLKRLLKEDPSLSNVTDAEEGWPVLFWAAMYGHNARSTHNKPVVDLLIDYGAELDIFAAAYLNMPERAAALLEKQPSLVQTADTRGWTALHYAAERSATEVAKLLLARGADANARDSKGHTPVDFASHPGPWKPQAATEIIQLLKVHGAEIDIFLAASIGDNDQISTLLRQDSELVRTRDAEGSEPLFYAAKNLHIHTVELLLERGADVNAKRDDGQTAISTAVVHMWDRGGSEIVELLRQHGATE